MTSERELRLFHTGGCHLCELAQEIVAPLADELGWRLQAVDIAEDDELHERYGLRIPVVREMTRGTELGWPFDAQAVRKLLRDDET
jgi:Glutaredoxin-like domain (DUF836)